MKTIEEPIKIFNRICKEENLFGSKWYKIQVNYLKKQMKEFGEKFSYEFHGYSDYVFSINDTELLAKQYKIQLLFLKALLDLGYFDKKRIQYYLKDMLSRYVTENARNNSINIGLAKKWSDITRISEREKIKKYFEEKLASS